MTDIKWLRIRPTGDIPFELFCKRGRGVKFNSGLPRIGELRQLSGRSGGRTQAGPPDSFKSRALDQSPIVRKPI